MALLEIMKPGWLAVKRNWAPFLLIQSFAAALVVSYYHFGPVRLIAHDISRYYDYLTPSSAVHRARTRRPAERRDLRFGRRATGERVVPAHDRESGNFPFHAGKARRKADRKIP